GFVQNSIREENALSKFIAKFGHLLRGILAGWDRLVIRGELRVLYAQNNGMQQYLKSNGVLVKDFRDHVHAVSQRLKSASLAEALASQRPVPYVRSPKASKEEIARAIAQRDRISDGLIAVLSCVQPS